QPGGFELYAESKGYFRDISYIPLDGLSEAETLKILGVDEKGNDLRGKNATASAAVPPGQWVKLFTKAEDLPAELRNPARGVKWEDGWIRWEVGKPHRFYVVDALSNYAIRATMLRQGKEYRPEWLMMRVDSPPSVAGYVFGVSTQNCLFAGRRTDESLSP
ncbi:MAG: hypothetical protein Q8M07_02950, partial [Prosthecobacter sp.]|nr:hypothetical protein [Prosthecobacter sp.]